LVRSLYNVVQTRFITSHEFKPGMWKRMRLNFCGSRSTLKKEAGREANLEATNFIRSWKQKIFYCFHYTSLVQNLFVLWKSNFELQYYCGWKVCVIL